MEEYINTLIEKNQQLNQWIDREKDSIMVYTAIKKDKMFYRYIFTFSNIIKRNVQCGNYKRAMRYYIMAYTLMEKIRKDKNNIVQTITDYVMQK